MAFQENHNVSMIVPRGYFGYGSIRFLFWSRFLSLLFEPYVRFHSFSLSSGS